MSRNNTKDPTPWAVYCHGGYGHPRPCGLVFLTREQYGQQLAQADAHWRCPRCGALASWDDWCQETNPLDGEEDHAGD